MLGCYGDGLLRKYGKTPPPEWAGAIGMLSDNQLERGLRRLVFGGKPHPPSLPEFVRASRSVGSDEFDDGHPTLPQLAGPDTWTGDVWDAAANRHLLAHLVKQLTLKKAVSYGRPASYDMMRASEDDLKKLGIDRHYLDASGEFVDNINRLVKAKNDWATDMRDLAVNGHVPSDTQKAVWHDLISTAEKRT